MSLSERPDFTKESESVETLVQPGMSNHLNLNETSPGALSRLAGTKPLRWVVNQLKSIDLALLNQQIIDNRDDYDFVESLIEQKEEREEVHEALLQLKKDRIEQIAAFVTWVNGLPKYRMMAELKNYTTPELTQFIDEIGTWKQDLKEQFATVGTHYQRAEELLTDQENALAAQVKLKQALDIRRELLLTEQMEQGIEDQATNYPLGIKELAHIDSLSEEQILPLKAKLQRLIDSSRRENRHSVAIEAQGYTQKLIRHQLELKHRLAPVVPIEQVRGVGVPAQNERLQPGVPSSGKLTKPKGSRWSRLSQVVGRTLSRWFGRS